MMIPEVMYMAQLLSKCPGCYETLRISALQCPSCGLELRNDFELGPFDQLDEGQYRFLLSFLQNRGNLKEVQAEMQISYPTAKKRLEELLTALHLGSPAKKEERREMDVSRLPVDYASKKPSEIIKAKLKEQGGHVTVFTVRGLPCEIYAEPDGKTFSSDKLPLKPYYDYGVFDVIVDLLVRQGGRARKGNGRNYKLGQPGCEENTVVGAIAKYRGFQPGDSVFDPVFVMAAVLEWAGIAENGRGELILSKSYETLL